MSEFTKETCAHCGKAFEVEVPDTLLKLEWVTFECPYCLREFDSQQLQKIVWKRDPLSGRYYTTLVPRHTKVDGFNLMPWEHT